MGGKSVSFLQLLLEVPNLVYGIIHECSNWLVVNLDAKKLCTTCPRRTRRCQTCPLWNKLVFRKRRNTILRHFVDNGNHLRTVIFQKIIRKGQKLRIFAESRLLDYKGVQTYQTYVTLECENFESKQFPVSGFKYYRGCTHCGRSLCGRKSATLRLWPQWVQPLYLLKRDPRCVTHCLILKTP